MKQGYRLVRRGIRGGRFYCKDAWPATDQRWHERKPIKLRLYDDIIAS